jgi:hypothetical protein
MTGISSSDGQQRLISTFLDKIDASTSELVGWQTDEESWATLRDYHAAVVLHETYYVRLTQ